MVKTLTTGMPGMVKILTTASTWTIITIGMWWTKSIYTTGIPRGRVRLVQQTAGTGKILTTGTPRKGQLKVLTHILGTGQ
jgi:hypothetical protein